MRNKEPLLRVVKHAELTGKQGFALRIFAVVLSLAVGGLFILLIGHNPFAIYGAML